MRGHALINNITEIAKSKFGYGLDKLQWIDVFTLIQDTFTYSEEQIQTVTRRQRDSIRITSSSNDDHFSEHEVENYTKEWTRKKDEIETDFTRD